MSDTENQKPEGDPVNPLIDDEGGIDLPVPEEESAETVTPEDIEVVETILEEESEDVVIESEESEIEKYKDIAARSQADLENYRKRMIRERTEAIQYANFSLLSTLLPVIDNFEMGLKAAQNEGENSIIYQGMAMVQKQLRDFLSENRVEVIEVSEGDDFDPNLHEAIKQEVSDTVAEGKIIYAMRSGYRLQDRLLRPAKRRRIKRKMKAEQAEEGGSA